MDGSDDQIRANANNLRERAREAAAKDGPLERSLRNFVTKAMQGYLADQS